MPTKRKKAKKADGETSLKERSLQAHAEARGEDTAQEEFAARQSVSYVGPRDGTEEAEEQFTERLEAAVTPEVVDEGIAASHSTRQTGTRTRRGS